MYWPMVVALPWSIDNLAPGLVVPMPTLPELITSVSLLFPRVNVPPLFPAGLAKIVKLPDELLLLMLEAESHPRSRPVVNILFAVTSPVVLTLN